MKEHANGRSPGYIEAVVVEGSRAVRCNDCGALLKQVRLEVASGPAKGVRVWATPTHARGAVVCPGRSVQEMKGER